MSKQNKKFGYHHTNFDFEEHCVQKGFPLAEPNSGANRNALSARYLHSVIGSFDVNTRLIGYYVFIFNADRHCKLHKRNLHNSIRRNWTGRTISLKKNKER